MSGDCICPQTKYDICLWPFQHCDLAWTDSSRANWSISVLFALCVHVSFCLSLLAPGAPLFAGKHAGKTEKQAHTHTLIKIGGRSGMDAASIRGWQTKCLDRHQTLRQHRGHQSSVKPLFNFLFHSQKNNGEAENDRGHTERLGYNAEDMMGCQLFLCLSVCVWLKETSQVLSSVTL